MDTTFDGYNMCIGRICCSKIVLFSYDYHFREQLQDFGKEAHGIIMPLSFIFRVFIRFRNFRGMFRGNMPLPEP